MQLDTLIDSMTLLAPGGRPSMEQVARDLRSWLRLGVERPGLNLDDIRAKVRARLQPQLAELDMRSRWKRQAEEAVVRIRTLIGPLNDELKSIHPGPALNRTYEKELDGLLTPRQNLSAGRTIFKWYTASWITVGSGPAPLQLKYGCGVALDEAGNLTILTVMISGYEGIMGEAFFRPPTVRIAPVGSIEAEEDIRAAIEELSSMLPEALDFFYCHLPGEEPD